MATTKIDTARSRASVLPPDPSGRRTHDDRTPHYRHRPLRTYGRVWSRGRTSAKKPTAESTMRTFFCYSFWGESLATKIDIFSLFLANGTRKTTSTSRHQAHFPHNCHAHFSTKSLIFLANGTFFVIGRIFLWQMCRNSTKICIFATRSFLTQ